MNHILQGLSYKNKLNSKIKTDTKIFKNENEYILKFATFVSNITQ